MTARPFVGRVLRHSFVHLCDLRHFAHPYESFPMAHPIRPRIFARSMPSTPALSLDQIKERLSRVPQESASSFDFLGADLFDPTLSSTEKVEQRAKSFHAAQKSTLTARLGHLKAEERKLIEAALGKGQYAGIHAQHQMHEKIAALHEESPWMAPAAVAVMQQMQRATIAGPAPFTMPPLLLVGKPGIGKSQWARALAETFTVPEITVDIGGSGGGIFALSGVERGWGSASAGRLVREMLSRHIVNPLVILDEVDKAPTDIGTSKGTSLPGLFEVLKSLIEPSTARAWTCPFYQLPFDMSRVNWVMTTNSIDRMPTAFLDRCKVIHLDDPKPEHLLMVARRRLTTLVDPEDIEPLTALIARQLDGPRRHSLRSLGRIIDKISAGLNAPRLI